MVKSDTKINGETTDNDIIYIAGSKDRLKASSKGLSCQNQSSIYLPVPQNAAGSVTMSVWGDAEGRWLQLYINGQEGTVNQRLWSKVGTDLSKKGPQTFNFTANDLTAKDGKYYLHFKDNNREMKISEFTILLTSGSYISTPKSTDATLKSLQYDGAGVPGFDANTTEYNVQLPATYTGFPTVTAETNDSKASKTITPVAAVPGDASVLVRAEDGTTTKTYTIHFTKAAADEPSITSFEVLGVKATIDQANKTITAELPLRSSLTQLTPTVSGDNINSYTPTGAQDFTNPVVYTVNSASGKSTQYTVTLTVEQPKSSDTSLGSLTVGGTAVPIVAGQTSYSVDVESGSAVPQVVATPNDTKAKCTVTQATSLTSTATVTVTAEDGTTATYTISFNITVPKTDLTIHYPGVYEESSSNGGYDGTLTVSGGREYEVYYAARNADEKATFNTTGQDKVTGVTKNESSSGCEAIDGWFKGTIKKMNSCSSPAQEEFTQGTSGREHRMQEGSSYKMHISGFDQFSIYAMDNKKDNSGKKPEDNRYFEIYIDGVVQPMQFNSSGYTIRRYSITTGEHVIEIRGIGTEDSKLVGFSLRRVDEPKVKYVSGNDTTQSVLVTRPMAPVTYYTKYNKNGETKLEWEGAEATGIALQKGGSDAIGDTLLLSGTPQCAAGVYAFRVVSYNQSQVATATLKGKITVATKIEAITDTIQDGFTNEAIDGFEFRYYANDRNDVTLTWDVTPAGIGGLGNNGTYTISGTPTQAGTYKFTVSVTGGNTITGQLRVTEFVPGDNAVLYLYKSTDAYEKDGVYQYLKTKRFNMAPRKAQDGLRDKAQYDKYKWVLISEDVDANNGEIMDLARGNKVSMPVLNMKSFSYSESRLDWGDPDNGSLNNKSVTVVQATHPIIKALGKKQGDQIEIISEVTGKGLMPAAVDYQGTLCIATATTRGEEYTGDGVEETFLHEVPATLRGGKKYICFPLSIQSSQNLTADGKKLIDACVDYLTNAASTIALPTLRIETLSIDGLSATIDQDNDSIYLQMPEETDLTALKPVVTLADATTHYTIPMAKEDGTVDFSTSNLLPVSITLSDYINVRNYSVVVVAKQKEQTAIEEVYQAGDWVTIYDIQGRVVRTTNEDLRTLSLPKGMYLVSTPRGTMKLMK